MKWQADLIDMQKFKHKNEGIRYLLTIIDVFSKYAIVRPLTDKKTETVADAFFEVFKLLRPLILLTDSGPEFTGVDVRQVCRIYGILYYTNHQTPQTTGQKD